MKSFLKYLLATVIGVGLTLTIFIFISIGFIAVLSSKGDKKVEIKDKTIYEIELNREIKDRDPDLPPFDFLGMGNSTPMGLNKILENIEKAKTDDRIKGIYLDLSFFVAGASKLEEIRNALADFSSSGKFIIAYAEYMSQPAYYIASVADKVYLNPVGMFDFRGLRSQQVFFSTTLNKMGLKPTIVRVGKFKSASEPFTEKKMSQENREQIGRVLQTYWESWVADIAESRNITVEELNRIADEIAVKEAIDAVELGLIDGLKYKDEIIDELKQISGIDSDKKLRTIGYSKFKKVPAKSECKGLAKNKIAVIYAEGTIVMGEGEDENIGSTKYSRLIRKARKDSTVKAIVIRINSGGGSALASDIILREMNLVKAVKPVIVSMGDIAASGGYYFPSAAHKILVNEKTLTGSIGVFAMHFNSKEMFNKIGINFDVEKTNERADLLSGVKDLSPADRAYLQHHVNVVYDTFLLHVANGRDMTKEEVHELAQGRIWSGTDAIENGLADEIGGLTEAVELAAELANLDDYNLREMPKLEDPLEKILKDLSGETQVNNVLSTLGISSSYFKQLKDVASRSEVKAMLPYTFDIY